MDLIEMDGKKILSNISSTTAMSLTKDEFVETYPETPEEAIDLAVARETTVDRRSRYRESLMRHLIKDTEVLRLGSADYAIHAIAAATARTVKDVEAEIRLINEEEDARNGDQ